MIKTQMQWSRELYIPVHFVVACVLNYIDEKLTFEYLDSSIHDYIHWSNLEELECTYQTGLTATLLIA